MDGQRGRPGPAALEHVVVERKHACAHAPSLPRLMAELVVKETASTPYHAIQTVVQVRRESRLAVKSLDIEFLHLL